MTTMTYLKPKRTLHNRKRKRIYDFPFAQSSQGAQAMIDTDTEWQSRGKQLIVQKVRNRRKQGWWSSFPSVVYSFAELPERLDPLEVIAGNKHPKYCSNTNSGKRIITLHYYLKNLWINHIMQQWWGHLSHIFYTSFSQKTSSFTRQCSQWWSKTIQLPWVPTCGYKTTSYYKTIGNTSWKYFSLELNNIQAAAYSLNVCWTHYRSDQ